DRLHAEHLQRGLEHLKRVLGLGLAGRRSVRAGTGRAWAFVSQVGQAVVAVVAILPIDFDSLRFGNRNVFGVCGNKHFNRRSQANSLSTSRTPEMRRMAATSFSSCFLSRTST